MNEGHLAIGRDLKEGPTTIGSAVYPTAAAISRAVKVAFLIGNEATKGIFSIGSRAPDESVKDALLAIRRHLENSAAATVTIAEPASIGRTVKIAFGVGNQIAIR